MTIGERYAVMEAFWNPKAKTPEEKKDNLRAHGFTFPGDKGHMSKTYKAVFSVGVGEDKDGFDIGYGTALNNRNIAITEASEIFGGVTVTENFGGWKDGENLVTEESWDFTIISDKWDKFREFGAFLRDLYMQSAVLLVVTEVESEFI